jgi:hypothetical protein
MKTNEKDAPLNDGDCEDGSPSRSGAYNTWSFCRRMAHVKLERASVYEKAN